MRRSSLFSFILFVLVVGPLVLATPASAQQKDFFGSNLNNWTTGVLNPNPPEFVPDGGPIGVEDGFMKAFGNGGVSGNQGKAIVVYNGSQWSGDYATSGLTSVTLDLKNFGTTELYIRLGFWDPPTPQFMSKDSIHVPVGAGWVSGTISLLEADLIDITGSANYAVITADVPELRIIHNTTRTWSPEAIIGTLGVDNITANVTHLPVELSSFEATTSNGVVDLKWQTADESNNVGFEVLERVGHDSSFEKVGFVGAKGSGSDYVYSLTRRAGDYSYRLRQIDTDGRATLHSVVEVGLVPDAFAIDAPYPNPVSGFATVDLLVPDAYNARVSVYDLLGREVDVLFDGTPSGLRTRISLDANNYAGGTYLLRAESNGRVVSRTLTIAR